MPVRLQGAGDALTLTGAGPHLLAPAGQSLLIRGNLTAGAAGADHVLDTSVARTAGYLLDAKNNNVSKATIDKDGAISAAPDTDTTHTIGKVRIHAAVSDYAFLSHLDDLTSFVRFGPSGGVTMNAKSNTTASMTHNSANSGGVVTVTSAKVSLGVPTELVELAATYLKVVAAQFRFTIANAEPADADVPANGCIFYRVESVHEFKCKVKYTDGTVKTAVLGNLI